MANVFLFHGAYGNPQGNWFSWLKNELEKLGHIVIAPQFSTPKNQSLTTWQNEFEKYRKDIDNNTIFIGHSLGCAFALNIIQKIDVKIKACFLVAGFIDNLNDPRFDTINHSFYKQGFDWQKIKRNCSEFYVYASENDPYVPIDRTQKVANNLKTKLILVKGAGHFTTKSGYKEFPLLLKDISTFLTLKT